MAEPTTAPGPPADVELVPLLAPVASLGLVLAGCPACHHVIGLDRAAGLDMAVAAHRRACPKWRRQPSPHAAPSPAATLPAADVCPGCGCEAALYPRADSARRCGDCLAEQFTSEVPT